jgi:hypothetical protein
MAEFFAKLRNFVVGLAEKPRQDLATVVTQHCCCPPPPPPLVTGGKGDCTSLFRNRKNTGAFSLHIDLPGGGVYDCTTYGGWGQTSWFLLVNSMFLPHKTSKTAGSGTHC